MKSFDVTLVVKTNVVVDENATEEQIAEIAIHKMLQNPSEYLTIENLDEVAGGGAFSNIPRVPTKNIDDKLRENI
jgi:hypothetical protein